MSNKEDQEEIIDVTKAYMVYRWIETNYPRYINIEIDNDVLLGLNLFMEANGGAMWESCILSLGLPFTLAVQAQRIAVEDYEMAAKIQEAVKDISVALGCCLPMSVEDERINKYVNIAPVELLECKEC